MNEPFDTLDIADGEIQTAELIRRYGLDLVLRVCARMALEREAAFRAVKDFTAVVRRDDD
jgi:hypothetical protein